MSWAGQPPRRQSWRDLIGPAICILERRLARWLQDEIDTEMASLAAAVEGD